MDEVNSTELSERLLETLYHYAVAWGPRVLAAILILLVGTWLSRRASNLVRASMQQRKVDPALVTFLGSLLYYALLTAVIIAAVGQVGIQTTSFLAVLGAAGLAVGLALQGSLSNFASGTLIILFRPFKVGDFINAAGTAGIVVEIGVLVTILRSADNQRIIVPNSAIMAGTITNVTANPIRRIDMTWSLRYGDDPVRVKEVIMDELVSHANVLEDPAPMVEVDSFGDHGVNYVVRPWTKSSDWWSTRCELMVRIKKRIDAEGMSIPYPQRDVHVIQQEGGPESPLGSA